MLRWVVVVALGTVGCGWAESAAPEPPWCDVATETCRQTLRTLVAETLGEKAADIEIVIGPVEAAEPAPPPSDPDPEIEELARRFWLAWYRIGWHAEPPPDPEPDPEPESESESESEETDAAAEPVAQSSHYDPNERRIVFVPGPEGTASADAVHSLVFLLALAQRDFRYGMGPWFATHAADDDQLLAGQAVWRGHAQLVLAIVDARLRGLDPVTELDFTLWLAAKVDLVRQALSFSFGWTWIAGHARFPDVWGPSLAVARWRAADHDMTALETLFVDPPKSTRGIWDLASGNPYVAPETPPLPDAAEAPDALFAVGAWDLALLFSERLGMDGAIVAVDGWRGGIAVLYPDDDIALITQWAEPTDAEAVATHFEALYEGSERAAYTVERDSARVTVWLR